jgi:hypothetical protein
MRRRQWELLLRLNVLVEAPDAGHGTNRRFEVRPESDEVLEACAERDLEGVRRLSTAG